MTAEGITLRGGAAADTLTGSAGVDTLWAGRAAGPAGRRASEPDRTWSTDCRRSRAAPGERARGRCGNRMRGQDVRTFVGSGYRNETKGKDSDVADGLIWWTVSELLEFREHRAKVNSLTLTGTDGDDIPYDNRHGPITRDMMGT